MRPYVLYPSTGPAVSFVGEWLTGGEYDIQLAEVYRTRSNGTLVLRIWEGPRSLVIVHRGNLEDLLARIEKTYPPLTEDIRKRQPANSERQTAAKLRQLANELPAAYELQADRLRDIAEELTADVCR